MVLRCSCLNSTTFKVPPPWGWSFGVADPLMEFRKPELGGHLETVWPVSVTGGLEGGWQVSLSPQVRTPASLLPSARHETSGQAGQHVPQ